MEPSPSYHRDGWRLLITPPCSGAENMAIDEAVLLSLAAGETKPTLRFYQWQPPCLSLGYNQSWQEVDTEACARRGYTWVRRPTGGRAILHIDELTYSVLTPQADERMAGGIVDSYRRLSKGLLAGLRKLGADVFQTQVEKTVIAQRGGACFDTPSNYEITVNGKKIMGSAQVRRKSMVLQHGSLPLYGDITRILEVLQPGDEEPGALLRELADRACTLQEALGRRIEFAEAAAALAEGMSAELNLELVSGGLNEQEIQRAEELKTTRYSADDWNRRL
jgi:lipoyl(octanoyl) transferase